jgi:hypothetical protein
MIIIESKNSLGTSRTTLGLYRTQSGNLWFSVIKECQWQRIKIPKHTHTGSKECSLPLIYHTNEIWGLMVVKMWKLVFWVAMLCGLIDRYQHFWNTGIYLKSTWHYNPEEQNWPIYHTFCTILGSGIFNHWIINVRQYTGPGKVSALADWFLYLKPIPRMRLTYRPDDGGSKDLWNVGKLLLDHMALQPRRQPSSTYFSLLECFLPNQVWK